MPQPSLCFCLQGLWSFHRLCSFAHPSQGSHIFWKVPEPLKKERKTDRLTNRFASSLFLLPQGRKGLYVNTGEMQLATSLSRYVRLFCTSASVDRRGFSLQSCLVLFLVLITSGPLWIRLCGVSLSICVLGEMAGTWCLFPLDIASRRTRPCCLVPERAGRCGCHAVCGVLLSIACYG